MDTVFETPRLTLSRHTPSDLDDVASMLGDMRVMRWVGGRTYPREEIESRLQVIFDYQSRTPYGFFVARCKQSGVFVGEGGIVPITRTGKDSRVFESRGPEIEVGYRFAFDHWGKGYATELTNAALQYAFQTVGLARVIGVTDPLNSASQAVLLKAGLRAVGPTDAYYDQTVSLYEITRDQYTG
jgi:RimJ/RimL family protein N-acetyltransferase